MSRLYDDFRPKSFSDFVGQAHILNQNSPLLKQISQQSLSHLLIFGPTGCGKTTFARLVSLEIGFEFYELNATTLKVEEIRTIVNNHKGTLVRALIFIDEFHRLSKNQQEVLLPIMEKHEALILGASSENPQFSIANGIKSRSIIIEFKKLSINDLLVLVDKVIVAKKITISDEAKNYLVRSSNGDARAMLNLLEMCMDGDIIDISKLKFFRPYSLSDSVASDDTHYDLASLFIKAMRRGDEESSLKHLASMIVGGESAEFIARRLVIFASEDVGNADANALILANACMQSVSKIGYPEAKIILAQATIYLSNASKSRDAYNKIAYEIDRIKQ